MQQELKKVSDCNAIITQMGLRQWENSTCAKGTIQYFYHSNVTGNGWLTTAEKQILPNNSSGSSILWLRRWAEDLCPVLNSAIDCLRSWASHLIPLQVPIR